MCVISGFVVNFKNFRLSDKISITIRLKFAHRASTLLTHVTNLLIIDCPERSNLKSSRPITSVTSQELYYSYKTVCVCPAVQSYRQKRLVRRRPFSTTHTRVEHTGAVPVDPTVAGKKKKEQSFTPVIHSHTGEEQSRLEGSFTRPVYY